MKTQWYVKELSDLTGVSVRALHHYDETELLKPSVRQSNGYRLYSQNDVVKLQQIVAYKSFGFNLKTIKQILEKQLSEIESLSKQKEIIGKNLDDLQNIYAKLNDIISSHVNKKLVVVEETIGLIGAYNMNKAINEEVIKQVTSVTFMSENDTRIMMDVQEKYREKNNLTPKDMMQAWMDFREKVKNNLHEDPTGPVGKEMLEASKVAAERSFLQPLKDSPTGESLMARMPKEFTPEQQEAIKKAIDDGKLRFEEYLMTLSEDVREVERAKMATMQAVNAWMEAAQKHHGNPK